MDEIILIIQISFLKTIAIDYSPNSYRRTDIS